MSIVKSDERKKIIIKKQALLMEMTTINQCGYTNKIMKVSRDDD
jgi:hypothetical protein